jgi:hypothetical protein
MRIIAYLSVALLLGCSVQDYTNENEQLKERVKELELLINRISKDELIPENDKAAPTNLNSEELDVILKHYSSKITWLNEQRSAAMRDIIRSLEKCKESESLENALEYIKTYEEKTKSRNKLKDDILITENNYNSRLSAIGSTKKVPGLREDTSKVSQQYYTELKQKYNLK